MNNRMAFIDFCQGLLNMNPIERWSPQQARLHPFITGEKWTKPWTVGVQVYTALIRVLMVLCSPLALRRLTLRPLATLPHQARAAPPWILSGHTEVWFPRSRRVLAPIKMPRRTISTWLSTKRTRRKRRQPLKLLRMSTETRTCNSSPRSRSRHRLTVATRRTTPLPTSLRPSSSQILPLRRLRTAP